MIRGSLPRIPYERIAREIFGRTPPAGRDAYQLSLVICGDSLAKKMNREYRHKSYAANVLSFPISKNEGEIFLNVRKAERETRQFGISVRKHMTRLFVHGCLHLKGLEHGARMDALEKKILASRF